MSFVFSGGFSMDSEMVLKVVARLIVLLVAIPIHETAHAYVSYRLGDPTAKMMGRLTLNPLKHIDLVGMLCMLTVGIGWAKPVPINPNYYRNRKGGMALSALAGPVSNFLLGYISYIISKVFLWIYVFGNSGDAINVLYTLFYLIAIIDVRLCVFNLLPIPPFDGSKIFGSLLPEKIYFGIMKYEQYIFIGVFILLYAGVLDTPLNFLNTAAVNCYDVLSRFVDAIMTRIYVPR